MTDLTCLATPEEGTSSFLDFFRLTMNRGEDLTIQTGGHEQVLIPLSGRCRITVEAGPDEGTELGPVGGRESIFGGPPEPAYLPRDSEYRVAAEDERFEAVIYAAPTEESGRPAHITGETVKAIAAGESDWSRTVYIALGEDGPATRIMVGETEMPPGNWSGFPPHRHTRHDPPGELRLEELYYLRIEPPTGFVLGGIYDDPENRQGTAEIGIYGDGELFDVPAGYHFIAGCPGYKVRYTWALAGPRKGFGAWKNDPEFSWVGDYAK